MLGNLADVEQLKEIIGEKDTLRYLQIRNPAIPEGTRKTQAKILLGNLLARWRRSIRDTVKLQTEWQELKHKAERILKQKQEQVFQNDIEIAEANTHIQEISASLRNINDWLDNAGRQVHSLLLWYETIATDHDFAQIINANIRDVEEARAEFDQEGIEGSFFVALVFVYAVEAENNNPFFKALLQMFRGEFARNTEFRQFANDKFEELFPEIRGMQYTVTTNEQGEEVLEKYYPPLKRIK